MTAPGPGLRVYVQHLRVTMSGTFQNGPGGNVLERWAYRLNLSDPGTVDGANYTQARCDDYAADAVAFHQRAGTQINAFCRLKEVKLARIGTNGKYLTTSFVTPLDAPGGSATAVNRPPQVALSISLGSATRGPRGRGRFYLPMPSHTLGTDLLIVPNDQEQLRLSVATFLADLNNTPGTTVPKPRLTIASSKNQNSDVTSFRVGRALDTIRSRREDLIEGYSAPTAVAP